MIRPLRVIWLILAIVWFSFVLGPASMRAADGAPVKVSAQESAKLLISSPVPSVWEIMKAGRMRAVVMLEFTVKEDGSVADIHVLSRQGEGADMYYNNPAKDSLSKWKYHPYTVNGRPTPMRTTVEFDLDALGYGWKAVFK